MLIDKVVTDGYNKQIPFKVEKLYPWAYYLVEIKLSKNNCEHKAIMSTRGYKEDVFSKDFEDDEDDSGTWVLNEEVELYSTGYDSSVIRKRIKDIFWFRIISLIDLEDRIKGSEVTISWSLDKISRDNEDRINESFHSGLDKYNSNKISHHFQSIDEDEIDPDLKEAARKDLDSYNSLIKRYKKI